MQNAIGGIREFINTNNWVMVILKILVIVLFVWVITHFAKRVYKRAFSTKNSLFSRFIYNIIISLVYLVGIVAAVSQIPELNKVSQTILAGSGILALGISLSAQESLNNIISGAFIALFKPFEVGDRITLINNNITGTVEDITLRHTVIKTFTNSRVVIPNSTINKEIIENSNLIDSKASSFIDIGIAYESDIDLAMQIMAKIIGGHPYFIDTRTEEEKSTLPKVKVYVRELGESSVNLRASMWTKSVSENFEACSDVRLAIKKEFEKCGIEIPYKKINIVT